MKITIFGATGLLGQPVTQELVNAGFEITAMVRNKDKAKERLPSEVKITEGDFYHIAHIEQAMEGAEAIYLNLSVKPSSKPKQFQPEREGLANILEAARKQKIKCIGHLSSLVQFYQGMNGFHWWAFEIKNRAIEQIKSSGIPYLIFYPSTFMENFYPGSYKQGKRIILAGNSKHPMYFIAGRDYGKQVAEAFKQFDGTSKEYVIQGPEAYTSSEAARIFAAYFTPEKLKVIMVPWGIMNFLGKFDPTFRYGAKITEALNNYPEKFQAEDTWKELGKPSITLKDYAQSF